MRTSEKRFDLSSKAGEIRQILPQLKDFFIKKFALGFYLE